MKIPNIRLTPGLLTESWELKLTALGLAVLLWAAVQSEDTTRYTMRNVPVELRMTETGWVPVGEPDPETIEVDFIGPVRELIRLAFAEATLVVPIEDVEDTLETYRPRDEWLEYSGRFDNLLVQSMQPAVVRLRFQPIESRMVPVAVRLDSPLKSTTRLAGPPVAEPARLLVEGPRDRVRAIDSVVVRIANVEGALRGGAVRLFVDTVGMGVTVTPREVLVRLRAAPPDTTDTLGTEETAFRSRRSGAARP